VAAFGGVEQIQNGGHCHGNQGAKNVKLIRITRIAIAKQKRTSPHPMAPTSKNDDDYQFAKQKLMKLDRNNIHI
jgi:hypothetical protein